MSEFLKSEIFKKLYTLDLFVNKPAKKLKCRQLLRKKAKLTEIFIRKRRNNKPLYTGNAKQKNMWVLCYRLFLITHQISPVMICHKATRSISKDNFENIFDEFLFCHREVSFKFIFKMGSKKDLMNNLFISLRYFIY